MKGWMKTLLIVGGILSLCGLVLLAVAVAMDGFRFGNVVNRFSPEQTEVTHEIEEPFSSVKVDCTESDVVIRKAEHGQCRVTCDDSEKVYHVVFVENGTLTVLRKDDRRWFERIGIRILKNSTVTVWLPEGEYDSLTAESVSGDVRVDSVQFSSASLLSVSGNVTAAEVVLRGNGSFSTTSGRVKVKNLSGNDLRICSVSGDLDVVSATGKTVSASTTSGAIKLTDVTAVGELGLDTVSGRMEFLRCDGGSLKIDTVSGDVSGSLLSPKKFSYDTTSGDVRIPPSEGVSPCEIDTTSGNVRIEIVSSEIR